MKIGAMTSSLRKPLESTLRTYSQMGLQGVQLSLVAEILTGTPEKLRKVRALCEQYNLEISAVCGDVASTHFCIAEEYLDRAELHCRVVDIAKQLGTKVVTTHIGVVPDDPADPCYPLMVESIRIAADYSARNGVTFAIETGPEKAEVLRDFIEKVASPGLGVNLDPANLRMVSCVDPVHAVEVLGKYIVHTHAKDGVNKVAGSAAARYGMFNPDGSKRVFAEPAAEFLEVPLGQGQVPWDGYLAALRRVGFDGFLTIERECGDNPQGDIELAMNFLKSKLN